MLKMLNSNNLLEVFNEVTSLLRIIVIISKTMADLELVFFNESDQMPPKEHKETRSTHGSCNALDRKDISLGTSETSTQVIDTFTVNKNHQSMYVNILI